MVNLSFRSLKDSGLMYKVTALMLIIVLIPLLISNILNIISVSEHLKGEISSKLVAIRDAKKEEIENFFQERYRDLEGMRRVGEIREGLIEFSQVFEQGFASPVYQEILQDHEGFYDYFITQYAYDDLFLINRQGDVVYTYQKKVQLGINLQDVEDSSCLLSQAFAQGLQQTSLVDFSYYEPAEKYVAFMSAPIQAQDGEVLGVIAFQLSEQTLHEIVQQPVGIGRSGRVYLVGVDRFVRSGYFADTCSRWVQKADTKTVQLAFAGQSGIESNRNFEEEQVFTAYAPLDINGLDWAIITEIKESEAYAVVYSLIKKLIIQALIFALAVLVVVYFSVRKITNPIHNVVAIIRNIVDQDEETLNISMIVIDPEGQCVFADDRANNLMGISVGEKIQNQPFSPIIIESIQKKEVIKRIEKFSNGETSKYIDISAFPVLSDNQVIGGVGVGIDITEKILLKNKLIDSERIFIMGEMTGRIIHDIRNMLQLSKLSVQMLEHYNQKDRLSKEKIHESLMTIDTTLNNVTELLSDLLQFSKPDNNSKEQPIQLGEFIQGQLRIFESTFEKNQIHCTVDFAEEITILAESKLIRQAFLNLIQNALDVLQNYDGERVLQITGRHGQGELLLEIYNTGPTIPDQFKDQIFNAFFTTKGNSGTGLGLATTKEIIENVYGGKIWFISSPEINGTAFFIRLPKSLEEGVS